MCHVRVMTARHILLSLIIIMLKETFAVISTLICIGHCQYSQVSVGLLGNIASRSKRHCLVALLDTYIDSKEVEHCFSSVNKFRTCIHIIVIVHICTYTHT